MLTIYGVYHSRASRVIWLANELDLPFHHVPVIQAERLPPDAPHGTLHTRSEAFLAINPLGQIPSIDDNGLVLHESLAINLYLARKHGGPLAARDLAEEAGIGQWTLFAATQLEPNALQILLQGAQPAAIEALRAPFAVLDRQLAKGALVGGRFTVADINVAEIVRYAMAASALFEPYPNLAAWLAVCHARPAFKAMYAKRLAEPA